ncbi:Glutaredoxin-C4 [Trichoplax sp. H2]|nr:Glutaredoxin-C4 [Trichoplax sp. H2]|eukprot:RDD41030.1 Glutaredoxin-C4 [Trichoplax sp. H2]
MGAIFSSSDNGNSEQCQKFIQDVISSHSVVIFSKTTCPYCSRVKTLFKNINVQPFVVELNQRDDMSACQSILGSMTGRTTVPRVFINGKSIGGCDDAHALHANGKLESLIKT